VWYGGGNHHEGATIAKHASKSSHLQLVDLPKTVGVQIPLPVLGALADTGDAFFDLCIDVGQQVFSVLKLWIQSPSSAS
jgi:hypothetical protein